jgi:basic membrane protein A
MVAAGFTACLVSDTAGFGDKSFNQSALDGLLKAEHELGVNVQTAQPATADDYAPQVQALVDEGCDLVIGVGALLAPAVRDTAQRHPDVSFALVDSQFVSDDGRVLTLPNARPLLFDTAQASYLAGYLSAGVSTTGTVATYGGLDIPAVTAFMDGFAGGVARYNTDNDAAVHVLGWDPATQAGTFVGSFTDRAAGRRVTSGFLDRGADVIMPVAGPVGLGTLAAITETGSHALFVGVDADWVLTNPEGAPVTLTSVVKQIGAAVHDTVVAAATGTFTADPYIGTLANGGVSLAPYHDLAAVVPDVLASKVEQVRQSIIDGTVTVTSPSSPR